jgi:hypothetical protein
MKFEQLPVMIPNDIYRMPINGVKAQTAKAYLIDFGDMELWMGKSNVSVGYNEQKILCLDVPMWLARREKLV